MTNRLAGETSPYLLQHAENPVDWYPWSEEALARAAEDDKPILLSIGYSACHWCHVMERESFENQETARIMNENYINIKVDREERPDLDSIYMEAVQALSGSGGWPLTVFLTPEGKPFYGGTYFPPEDRQGLPGFPRVLETVARAFETRRSEVDAAAEQLLAHLSQALEVRRQVEPLLAATLDNAFTALQITFDTQEGGFGLAPKFPQLMILEFLLRYHERTGDRDALSMVEHTLEQMARGGIYDQIGGGFHRYSVDAHWLVPHFEKMLYDNALLSRVYLHTYQVTGKPLYRRIVEETLDYVLREMRDGEGGFYSTQDADSEGVEGRYYTWTLDEVLETLGEDEGKLASRYFGITKDGNFQGTNILSQAIEIDRLASELALDIDELEARIAAAKSRLLERRASRVPPHRDEKILTNWNGLMLASLAEAASVLDRRDYLEAALCNAAFLTLPLEDGQPLQHLRKQGQARCDGYLQDYAFLAEGLISLYESTFQERWLHAAIGLGRAMLDRFWDEEHNCFYDTDSCQEALFVRPSIVYDSALPSGSAAAALVLMRLSRLTDKSDLESPAAAAIRSVQQLMVRNPIGFGHWLCALDFYLSKPNEIAVVGRLKDPATKSLLAVINQRYLPNRIMAGLDPGESTRILNIPLLQNRVMIRGEPTVYVCERYICRTPVTDPDALGHLLDGG